MSVTDVQARIQQLQGQFAAMTATAAPRTVAAAAPGTSFADALSGAGDTLATSDASNGTAPAVGSGTGQAVVDEARKYLGVPYVWGGTNPRTGLDCSGLVQQVYEKFGIDLPRVSYQQARAGQAVSGLAQAQPGDILAFGSPVHHVAIYMGDGKMIEAPRPGKDVQISDVYETPSAIRRVLPSSSPASVAARTTVPGDLAATPYASLFTAAEQKYGVSATLLAAVAHQESGFQPRVVSPAGARGLMQLMPGTAKGLGVNPDNPAEAVDGAARMLRNLVREFGRVDHALAAYNAGPGAVHRYHGIPPYPETRSYVPAVLGYQRTLEAS
jgi:peptidoglycan DL-endopeptidase CwlO